jgi:hypothetical protein
MYGIFLDCPAGLMCERYGSRGTDVCAVVYLMNLVSRVLCLKIWCVCVCGSVPEDLVCVCVV